MKSLKRFGLIGLFFFLVIFIITACPRPTPTPKPTPAPTPTPTSVPAPEVKFVNPQLLVSTEWLAAHLTDPNVRIVDARDKADDYAKEHIPGAVHISRGMTFDPAKPAHWQMVGTPEQISKLFGDKGINETYHVVVYGTHGIEYDAARVFWTLEYYGHPNVSILNGGFKKWKAEGRPTTTEVPKVTPVTFTVKADPTKIATAEEIMAGYKQGARVKVIDNRSLGEYVGIDKRGKGPGREGGHIPGAVFIDYQEFYTKEDVPVLKSPAELSAMLQAAGVRKDQTVITHCQTGQRSAVGYFVLRLLGYNAKNYDGSWAQWSDTPELPIEIAILK